MDNEYIEISDKTLDDCITQACRKLRVTSDNLDYEVVDQGSLGFMGFNSRNAVIRARIRENESGSAAASGDVLDNVHHMDESVEESNGSAVEDTEETEYKRADHSFGSSDFTRSSGRSGSRERYGHGRGGRSYDRSSYGHSGRNYEPASDFSSVDNVPESHKRPEEPHVDYSDDQIAEFEKKADNFLKPMFQAMEMEVSVSYEFDKEENILNIDFEGDDMGILIGKRGQTLDSIQYLVSLVVNKGIEGYVHIKADTEDYRARRRRTLENLAKNIAFKVKRTHKAQALEPMNPYERRIIHSALQGDRYVTTYSEGEDPYRRVVITPKKG